MVFRPHFIDFGLMLPYRDLFITYRHAPIEGREDPRTKVTEVFESGYLISLCTGYQRTGDSAGGTFRVKSASGQRLRAAREKFQLDISSTPARRGKNILSLLEAFNDFARDPESGIQPHSYDMGYYKCHHISHLTVYGTQHHYTKQSISHTLPVTPLGFTEQLDAMENGPIASLKSAISSHTANFATLHERQEVCPTACNAIRVPHRVPSACHPRAIRVPLCAICVPPCAICVSALCAIRVQSVCNPHAIRMQSVCCPACNPCAHCVQSVCPPPPCVPTACNPCAPCVRPAAQTFHGTSCPKKQKDVGFHYLELLHCGGKC